MHISRILSTALTVGSAVSTVIPRSQPIWLTLPPTPSLPSPISPKTYPIDGVQLWMQKYNEQPEKRPIVMDHGGLGYSAYFGSVISQLVSAGHYVIAVDRLGHGRSTFNANDVFTYDQMAIDTFHLLAAQGVTEYDIVGWSDGAVTTLSALMNPVTATPIKKAFLFGTTATPGDSNATFSSTAIFGEFVSRCRTEYAELQPTADFTRFGTKVATMEATLPQFTDEQLGKIDGSQMIIVGAEHEEAVNFDVPARLHNAIKGSTLEILQGVSHFAPLQNPTGFTDAIVKFFYQ